MSKTAGYVDKVRVRCKSNSRTGGQVTNIHTVKKNANSTGTKYTQNIHTAKKNANCNGTKQTSFFLFKERSFQ